MNYYGTFLSKIALYWAK